MWKRYQGKVRGVQIEGDKASPPTKWWNHLFLALWGWKMVTVFGVSEADARRGYQIGYLSFDGKAMVKNNMNYDRCFRMKNGREDCTFFAVTPDGKEIPLEVVARTNVTDVSWKDVPLH